MTPQRQPKTGDNMRLSITIAPDLYDLVKERAELEDVSFSAIAAELIEKGLRVPERLTRVLGAADVGDGEATTVGGARTPVPDSTGLPDKLHNPNDHAGHTLKKTSYGTFCVDCQVRVK